jgi:hypothetical protein
MVQGNVFMVLKVVEMLGIKGSFTSHQKEIVSKVEETQKLVDNVASSVLMELQGLQKAQLGGSPVKEIKCVRDAKDDKGVKNLIDKYAYNVAMRFVMDRLIDLGMRNLTITREIYLTPDGVCSKFNFIKK